MLSYLRLVLNICCSGADKTDRSQSLGCEKRVDIDDNMIIGAVRIYDFNN